MNWIDEAAEEIIDGADVPTGLGGQYRASVKAWIVAAIARHCPIKVDDVNGWADKGGRILGPQRPGRYECRFVYESRCLYNRVVR